MSKNTNERFEGTMPIVNAALFLAFYVCAFGGFWLDDIRGLMVGVTVWGVLMLLGNPGPWRRATLLAHLFSGFRH